MSQYSVNRKAHYPGGNTDIHEVVMLADQFGNVIGPANPSGVAVDAFGRARVSTPLTLFDSSNVNYKNEKFDELITGTGSISYSTYQSSVLLSNGTASGNSILRQSKRYFSYQPGKSLLILNTAVFNSPQTNLVQRVGYYDDDNGIFLEQNGNTTNIVMRTSISGSIVETRIPQTQWNSDAFDGDGSSHITLDTAKAQIFWIDIEWLGVGSVRTGFVIDGQFIVAHTFHNANIIQSVYITSANLPVRYEIINNGELAEPATLKQICSSVISEGGYEARALQHVYGTSLAGHATATANTFINLVTIKMSQNKAIVIPSGADILNISNADFEWGLFVNATPDSALTFNQATNNVQYALNAVNISGGRKVAGGYMGGKTAPYALGDGSFDWDYQLGQTIPGVSDTLTLAVRASTTNKSAAGILKWFEL